MVRFDLEFFGGVLCGLVIGIAIMIILLPRMAHGQELDRIVSACLTEPGVSAKAPIWAWRMVEGRKCWYAGARGREKSTLYWKEAIPDPPKPAPVPDPEKPEPVPEPRVVEPPPPVTVGETYPFPEDRWWLH